MKLIVGLGNIGREYQKTRHNVGFMCLDRFASRLGLKFRKTGIYSSARFLDSLMIKPGTYMNNSGDAYKSAISRKGGFEDMLIILDDIELPAGEIRIRPSGGNGGHNGLKSILNAAGTLEVKRMRIGIGRPDNGSTRDHVLDLFTSSEWEIVDGVLSLCSVWLELFVRYGFNRLLNEYSQWKKNPIPPIQGGINRPKEETE